MEIKNLEKVAQRIKKAIRNNERIILYGDADLDGVVSVIILKEVIKNFSGGVSLIYFPDREKEGYGLNQTALNFLKEKAPALLITLDCGIGNFKEVELAKKIGFEVIIIDHHEILDKIPPASIIVDPKQKRDKYPFKFLSTAGICFRFSQIFLGDKLSKSLRNSFLELVALATIADMMPQENENKILIEEGLLSLKNTWRPGLKVFFKINETKNYQNIRELSQKVISVLNISDLKENHLNETYLVLTSTSIEEAEALVKALIEKSYQRQERISRIAQEIEEGVSQKLKEPIVFEGDENWSTSLIGSVASKICNLYKKPTFIFSRKDLESQGAVRTPFGIDSVALMKKCQQYLVTYGGHPPASGFRIKNENLEKFKECLICQFKQ